MSSREVQCHNQTVLESLKPGDLVEFPCGVYSHWAVYVGDNQVVHMAGVDGSNIELSCPISGQEFNKVIVRKDGFWEVVGDGKAYKNNSKDNIMIHFKPSEIVKRAESQIGKVGNYMLFKNCEHFALNCRYNPMQSDQGGLAIQGHNDSVWSSLVPGDQVEFERGLYCHWGVYIGDGYVIHLASVDGQSFDKAETAVVRKDEIVDVAGNSRMNKNNSKEEKYGLKPYSKSEIVRRAKSQLGRTGYDLLASNCEHFASWCCYDIEISDQVPDGIQLTRKAAEIFFNWLLEKS